MYAKIRDARSLQWRAVKTPFKRDSPAARRNALVWANEQDRVGKASIKLTRHFGWSWVFAWLGQAFAYNRNTMVRYETCWAHLNEFLVEHGIRSPAELLYKHASEYMVWRTTQVRRRGTTINHNTALTEAKVMSRILQEARRRELIQANPWAQLGIRRKNVRHAPAMTQAEIDAWRAALVKEEGALPIEQRWMTVCFEIALLQTVRLSATEVPMSRVHLDERTGPGLNLDRITFEEKGRNGVKKIKTLPVNPGLRPMLLALRAAGAGWTCVFPRSKRGLSLAGIAWWKFRVRHEMGHLRFHSTRSTGATEMARRGVSKQKAMEVMGQKSDAVHFAYLHLTADDVADAIGVLDFGKPGGSENPGGPSPTR